MKQLIPIVSFAMFMVACNNKPSTEVPTNAVPQVQQATAINTDTVGLAQFQEWKAAYELAAVAEYKAVVAKPVKKAKKVYTAPVSKTSSDASTTGNNSSNSVPRNSEEQTMSSESADMAKAPEKRGWSKAAKGTAIGVGTGAAAGAVINKKNRVVGGVIGGVVGGAVGYGIGRHMDKRDGRY